jgi:hypothetical protein
MRFARGRDRGAAVPGPMVSLANRFGGARDARLNPYWVRPDTGPIPV